jgi:hypothetical protein
MEARAMKQSAISPQPSATAKVAGGLLIAEIGLYYARRPRLAPGEHVPDIVDNPG